MTDPLEKFSAENIAAALKGFYTPPRPGNTILEGDALLSMLQTLSSLSVEDHVEPILVQAQRHHRGTSFNPVDHATLAFVDDAITQVLRQTDLDFKIESFVRDLAPLVAIHALRDGIRSITHPLPLLGLVDTLIRQCIGWSEDLGILGDQFMDKLEAIIKPLVNNRTDIETCQKELTAFFGREDPIFAKMEQRLCDSEMKVLAGQKAKFYAAEVLNKQMSGRQLPLFIIFMLQGSWYEFLQDVFIHHGQKSKEWQNVTKLTEALVWSLRPQDDAAKHQSLMASLPGQITTFCGRMKFTTDQVEACMADVEAEYEQINAGTPSDPCDFDLIEVDTSVGDGNRGLDANTMATIESFEAGQWFLYDDPDEPEEKVARIKLILNWNDTERLLFTNHNRRKVMHMGYGEMAGHLADNSIRSLMPKAEAHTIIHQHLVTVIQGIQQQKKKEVQIEEVEARKEISQEYLAKRKAALVSALEQHHKQAEEKRKRAMVLRHKAEQKLEAATQAVKALRVEAWVKLPIMEGTLTPCRLVAIIPGADKYIFANRAGIKVGEYTGGQLSHMIVTENSEILDTGEEFASVLASVVTGLREDRNKSYEELTGDTA